MPSSNIANNAPAWTVVAVAAALLLAVVGCALSLRDIAANDVNPAEAGPPQHGGNANSGERQRRGETAARVAIGAPAWWQAVHNEVDGEMQAGGMGAGADDDEARQAAVHAARRSLAEARRVVIQGELQIEAASEVRQGDLYEVRRVADRSASYVAATLGETRVARVETRPYRDGDETGVLAWAHVRVPMERLYPHRRLNALLARRPAEDADAAERTAWFAELGALGETYRGEGEAALAAGVLRLLAAHRGEAEDYLTLAEHHAAHGQIAGAVTALERLQSQLVTGESTEDATLRTQVTSRLAELRPRLRSWEALADALLGRFDRQADDARLRLLPIGGRHLRVNVGSNIAITTEEPQVVALFWLDAAGLYGWDWRGPAPMIKGQRTLTATADTAGPLAILAVAAPAALPAFTRTPLPVESAAVRAGNRDAIAAFESFLAELDEWAAAPDTLLAILRLHVAE